MYNNEAQHNTEDDIFALMMDALDGELDDHGRETLDTLLAQQPHLQPEWAAMQQIDTLFTQSPLVAPAPTMRFAQRTVTRLPNLQARRWLTGTLFAFFAGTGLLPIALIALALVGLDINVVQIGTVLFEVLDQMLIAFGNRLAQQPSIVGVLLVMIGSISLWTGVYQQMTRQPQIA